MSSIVSPATPPRFVFGALSQASSSSPVPLSPIRIPAKKVCPHKPARPSRASAAQRTPRLHRIFCTDTDNSFVSTLPEPPAKRRRIERLPTVPESDEGSSDPVFAALAASFAALTVSSNH